jgi:hypothetical protein
VAWRDEYIKLPLLQSPAQRCYKAAVSKWGYDERNRLVANVFYCLWARIHLIHQRQRNTGRDCLGASNIKKYPKTDAKTLSIPPLSVLRQLLPCGNAKSVACFPVGVQIGEPAQRTGFSVSLWLVYLDNLFLGSP